jgi:hypothetical protein
VVAKPSLAICRDFIWQSVLSSDDFDIERVIALLNAVLSNESDDVIWNKVDAAAAEHVPPSIFNKAALDTPLKIHLLLTRQRTDS